MNIYEYNSNAINVFSTVDNGSIASAVSSTINNGLITELVAGPDYVVLSGDFIVPLNSDFTIGSEFLVTYGYVFDTQTVYPYGSIKFNSTANAARSVIFIAAVEPIKLSSIEINSTRKVWVGTGTLFEIGGGQELTAFSWLASSGPLRVSGSAGSKAIYSYNNSSIEGIPNSTNYGSISGAHTASENYGSVADISGGNFFDYGYIINQTSAYPFGTFSVLGASNVSISNATYIGSGSLFAISGTSTALVKTAKEKLEVIKITGSASITRANYFSGSGTILNSGFDIEKVSYDYNESSTTSFDSTDFGSITVSGSTVNYSSIITGASEFYNYGFVYDSTNNTPHGNIKLTGSVSEIFKPAFAQTTTGSFYIFGAASKTEFKPVWNSSGTIILSGGEANNNAKVFIGSGNISNLKGSSDSITYDYNESSIVSVDGLYDYGSITDFVYGSDYIVTSGDLIIALGSDAIIGGSDVISYGFINDPIQTPYDYGYVYDGLYPVYPYGTLKFGGESSQKFNRIFAPEDKGSLFAIGGSSDSRTISKPESTSLFRVSGDAITKVASRYIASGSFSNIGSKQEKATFSYNTSSTNLYSSVDYGLITASGVSVNYGSITNGSSVNYDYNYIITNQPLYPFGTLTLTGAVSEDFKPIFAQTSTGGIFISGNSKTQFKPVWASTGDLKITGDAQYRQIKPYIGSGYFDQIGSKEEKATFSYNSSSIETYGTTDYGFITASGVSVNYGLVSNIATQEFDYGDIWINNTTYPYGTLNLSGSSADNLSRGTYKSTGSLFAFGSSAEVEVNTKSESKIVFKISGESSVRAAASYDASGSFSKIGSKIERATFSYNSSSIETYGTTDYGFITASGVSIDYQFIFNAPSQEFDYGDIWINNTTYPYGTLNLSGSSADNLSRGTYKSTGSLFAFGSSAEVEVNIQDKSTTLFVLSGSSTSSFIRSSVGSGSFSNVGYKIEKATYDYNESSIANYGPDIDLGTIADIVYGSEYVINSGDLIVPLGNDLILDDSNIISYGYVSDSSIQDINYGYVYQTDTIYPYGTINISGSAIEDFEFLFVQVGSGSLFAIGGTSATIPYRNISSKDVISITGSASVNFSIGYVANGTLNKIGSKIERATYSYNTSSIDLYNIVDHGFIDQVGVNENYGSVIDVLDTAEVNYGVIWNLTNAYPFGSLNITGAVKYDETRYIPSITGTGSLFAIGGDANAYSRIAVTEKQTFVVSGNSAEAKSKTFIGTGSLFTIGGLTISATANPKEENQLFRISGDAIERHTESYVGTGSVYLQTGIYPEYLYYRPTPRYVNSIYGEIGGSAFINGDAGTRYFAVYTHVTSGSVYISGDSIPRFLPIFYGSGNIFISGTASEKEVDVFTGSGSLFAISGASESRTTNPPEENQLFRISGAASERQTDTHVAFITAEVRGESRVLRTSAFTGDIEISIDGSKIEKRSITQVGSGSFSIIKGSAEVYSTNPPEETVLFRVSGEASTRYISVYTHVSSGSEFISGNSAESRTNKFNGSGTLFEIGGGAQEFTAVPSTETAVFRVSGSAVDKFRRQFVSSGSEFISGFSSESKSRTFVGFGSIFVTGDSIISRSRSGESSGRLVLSGDVYNISQKSFNGSGSLFTINGATQSKVVSDKTTDSVLSISGNAEIRVAVKNETSGSKYIYGSSIESHTEAFVGSGSLFKFSSAVVASNFATITDTILFRISGDSTNSITYDYNGEFGGFGELIVDGDFEVIGDYIIEDQPINGFTNISGEARVNVISKYDGSGSEFISGDATVRDISSYVGDGSLFGFGGTAESSTSNPPEERVVIKISGEATNIQRTKSEFASGSYTYQGNSTERKTNVFVGSGSLFSVISSTSSTSIQIREQESNELFTISGESRNSYSRISQFESGKIIISGKSTDETIFFTPPRVFGTII